MNSFVPVLQPRLPSADAVMPWLRQIDETRWYSNFGPLERLFRERLGKLAGLDVDRVALFSSGTAAITVALRSLARKTDGLCVCPSWTHVGTASAIVAAGLRPRFVDCDARTWAIDPAILGAQLDLSDVSAVVPVAPFGAHIDYAAWESFSRETRIPVVIDGAAGFDQFVHFGAEVAWGRTPVMVSLHATKVFGVGEGGLLLSRDAELIRRTQQLSNFGIFDDRPIDNSFANAKMSEYGAAVGLAFLDIWGERRSRLSELGSKLRCRLEKGGVVVGPGFADRFVSSTCMVCVPDLAAESLEQRLTELGIGVRRWWRRGVHRLPSFASYPRSALPITEMIADRYLGIPFYPDMSDAALDRVLDAVSAARMR
jgi:dTDP-4-amino-4,6-dideoxygalactose transaminase